jgi:protein-L-isoaspartate(D-aspartate) O-methyltransferase
MTDFAAARAFMVQGQVRVNDVTDPRLTAAMLEMPRERFVPPSLAALAYLDRDLPLTHGRAHPQRYLLKPMTLAKLIQAAEVTPLDRVLDVGCATGYAAALLAQLGAAVVALEEEAELARHAARNLADLGLAQVSVVTGLLLEGWAAAAPYDVILVEGRCEAPPKRLLTQLRDGGRLVCVQGRGTGAKGMVYRATQGDASGWPLFEAVAPLLPGFAEPPAFVF